mgnify:CR=1 FL=1
MKLMFFNDFRLGVVKGDRVVDVTSIVSGVPHARPQELMTGVIAAFADVRGAIGFSSFGVLLYYAIAHAAAL